jgi:hypothetical protein
VNFGSWGARRVDVKALVVGTTSAREEGRRRVKHAVEHYVVSRGLDLTPVSMHRFRWSAGALERWDRAAG